MLAAPPRIAWSVAAAAALAAGTAAAVRVAPAGPWVALHLTQMVVTAERQVWELRAEPRGGETIGTIAIEYERGVVGLLGRDTFTDVPPDNAAVFTLSARRDVPADPVVRIVQDGRVRRTYDVRLPLDRPRGGDGPR